MGMDRNTLIGFGLIGALLITMFVINSKSRLAYEGEQKRISDSIAALKPKVDTTDLTINAAKTDTNTIKNNQNDFQAANEIGEKIEIENEVLKLTFSSKGAQPINVILKKFKKADGTPVVILDGEYNKFSYAINTATNQTANSADIIFAIQPIVNNADKSQTLSFIKADSTGKQLVHQYIIRPNDYMIDLNISVQSVPQLFTQNIVNFLWQSEAERIEKDHKYELTQTNIAYHENGAFDFEI